MKNIHIFAGLKISNMKITKKQLDEILSTFMDLEIELTDYDYDDNGEGFSFFKTESYSIESLDLRCIIDFRFKGIYSHDLDKSVFTINDINEFMYDGEVVELNQEYTHKIKEFLLTILY